MKRWAVGLTALFLVVVLAWTYRQAAFAVFQEYVNPDPEDPVPTLELVQRSYRVLVQAEGELTGLKMTPVVTPKVRRGGLKIAWMREEGALVQPGEVLVRFDSSEAQLALQENQNQVSTLGQRIDKTTTDSSTEMRILEVDREAADLEYEFSRSQIRRDEEIFSRWEIQESLMSSALAEFKQLSVDERASLRSQLTEADLEILDIEKKQANTEVELAVEALSSLELGDLLEEFSSTNATAGATWKSAAKCGLARSFWKSPISTSFEPGSTSRNQTSPESVSATQPR